MRQNNQLLWKWIIFARSLVPNSIQLGLTESIFILSSIGYLGLVTSQTVGAMPVIPLPNDTPRKPPKPLPPLPEIIPAPQNSPTPIPLTPEKIPGKITVKKFIILGNKVIPPEEIEKVLVNYHSRPLSFLELLIVPRKITQLYIDRGYITSGAFIPPQTIENGVVKIEILEGKIEEIKISGLTRLNEKYIRSRLEIATKSPLNQNKLVNALQLLQINPLIANISAELSTGIEPGSSLLRVDIQEANTFAASLRVDNRETPSIGEISRQITLDSNNLLGLGDGLLIAYTNTDGSNGLNNLSYSLPINARNGKLNLFYSLQDSEIIEGTFKDLDIETQNSNFEVSLVQPLYQTPRKNLALGLALSRQTSKNTLQDIPFPLSEGADLRGETKISVLRLFQEYSDRHEKQVIAFRSQFSFGIDAFDATINENLPDGEFFTWRGQAQYLRILSPSTTILVQSDLQLAGSPIVSLEQFSLGGVDTIRGYRQDTVIGDDGLFISAEISNTVLNLSQLKTKVEIIPFWDFGTVWNTDSEKIDNRVLSSLGIGLRLSIDDTFAARLDWGLPLLPVDSVGDSLQDNGLYFSLELKPFK
jgi:hemolysin activation/secretion protein